MKFSKRCFENLGTFASAKVQVETFFYNRFSSFTNSQAVKLKFGFSKIVKSVKQSFADLIKSIVKTISFYATLEACGRGIKKKKGGDKGSDFAISAPLSPFKKKASNLRKFKTAKFKFGFYIFKILVFRVTEANFQSVALKI